MAFELDGVVSKVGDGVYDVRYERRYSVPIEAVWAALTEPKRLADWLAEAKLDLRLGGTIELYWPTPDERMTGKSSSSIRRGFSRSPGRNPMAHQTQLCDGS